MDACPSPTHRLSLLAATAALVFSAGARAEVAQVPLTLTPGAEPNIMLVIDDSGSMDAEILLPTNDGAFWWDTCDGQGGDCEPGFFTEQGGVLLPNFNDAGAANARWKKYIYLFPIGTGAGDGRRVYGDGGNDHYAVPPMPEYGFVRSSAYNAQYYNPMVEYQPWPSTADLSFADADPAAARLDPMRGAGNTLDLTQTVDVDQDNWRFRVHTGMRENDDSMRNGGHTSQAFEYFPATYYWPTDASISLGALGAYNCDSPDSAAYAAYLEGLEDDPAATQSTLEGLGVDAIGPDGRCLVRYEINGAASFPSGRSLADERQNFANWFSYHRKRHLALRSGMGAAFVDQSSMRIGGFTINNRVDPVNMLDIDDSRDDLLEFLYEIGGNGGGTPNRQALLHAGNQYDTDTDIVTLACQQNFVLQFTDGFSTTWTGAGVGNADGDQGEPFADEDSDTIADIAMRYYQDGIRDDLDDNLVPVPPQCSEADPAPWLDCNNDPHLNHYAITLGAQGRIFGVTHDDVRDAHDNPPTWQDPNGERSPVQVDDLFHAAVNGRGQMLNARSTDELAETLDRALRAILENVLSSASVVSSNSTRLDTDTLIYQARFDSGGWTGELLAYSLEPDGAIGDLEFDAGLEIPAAASRNIFTRTSTGTRIEFEWDELDATQQAALNLDSGGSNDGRGEERVAWLRGSSAGEARNGGPFRNRSRLLGDIVNSSPWFVGNQNFGYDRLPVGSAGRDTYQDYRVAQATRRKMIYVGANDGMLHAFDAETGAERFAFIPSSLIPDLVQLTDPGYQHRYFVDGTPIAGDAYIDAGWKTMLVGTLGAGGRSVFALDVTNPDSFDENSIRWEFSDPDLGQVIGRPSIARMANGTWAAIFGSGYGLDKSAKLFIVNLADGSLIRKISTVRAADEATAAANGMGPPFPVDGDGDGIAEIIYAGDLYGNLWKFDVSASNASSWGSKFTVSPGSTPRPLVTVCASGDVAGPFACPANQRQPITMRPVVGRAPDEGLAVYFGTGKFFEVGDNLVDANTATQSFYGIFDDNTTTGNASGDRLAGRSELVEQEIIAEVEFDADDEVRATSQNPVAADDRGWYMDLVSPENGFEGERAVAQPLLREGRLIFTTLIPSGDPCEGGGSSWLMELSATDGGRFDYPVFDLDDDGTFTDEDTITITDDEGNEIQVSPSGRRSGVGVIQTPAIIEAGEVEYKVTGGSSGGVESIRERGRLSKGRNSWRQLWPND